MKAKNAEVLPATVETDGAETTTEQQQYKVFLNLRLSGVLMYAEVAIVASSEDEATEKAESLIDDTTLPGDTVFEIPNLGLTTTYGAIALGLSRQDIYLAEFEAMNFGVIEAPRAATAKAGV